MVLTGLRKLRAALTEAASHSRPTPTVMMALSDVRRRYDDLMERAADAPGATLGQQLYNARIHAKLSAHEAVSGLFQYNARFTSTNLEIDFSEILGQSICIEAQLAEVVRMLEALRAIRAAGKRGRPRSEHAFCFALDGEDFPYPLERVAANARGPHTTRRDQ